MPIDPQDGGPDDWFVPASDGYPDDWFVPPSSAAGMAPPASGTRPGTADPTPATRPAPRPDPLAAYWASIPPRPAGARAWHPPIFPPSPAPPPPPPPPPLTP